MNLWIIESKAWILPEEEGRRCGQRRRDIAGAKKGERDSPTRKSAHQAELCKQQACTNPLGAPQEGGGPHSLCGSLRETGFSALAKSPPPRPGMEAQYRLPEGRQIRVQVDLDKE